jgi:hypothetical protein
MLQPKGRAFSAVAFALTVLVLPACAASTWYVNHATGSDKNDCTAPATACKTILHAIALAGSGGLIVVAAGVYYENLAIDTSVSITGSGARSTIIDGQGIAGVIAIFDGADVIISNVTIRNGFATYGAGVFNQGKLTINDSAVVNNNAGVGIQGAGGGIYNAGTLTLNSSTVSNNSVSGQDAYGGGIFSNGGGETSLSVNNSTISGNSSAETGGGIESYCCFTSINNSTIVGNAASISGGGILINSEARIQNSILANNGSAGNCQGSITSESYNLSSDNTCNFGGSGDLNNVQPMLGSLMNNGGPTNTIAEQLGSPTIDAGNPDGCTGGEGNLLIHDQRGKPRPGQYKSDKRCDMGAYESQTD